MEPVTIKYGDYTITTDKTLMRVDDIHHWLCEKSYWAKHIPFETVKGAFDHSFCIGVLIDGRQVGYARLITDYNTFAYMADVYVEEEHRGRGLSKQMMQVLMGLDWVGKLRKILLATVDAHGLYAQFGFAKLKSPDRLMDITRVGIYGDTKSIIN